MTIYIHLTCININREKCLYLIDSRLCRSFVFIIIMKMYNPILQKVNRKYVFFLETFLVFLIIRSKADQLSRIFIILQNPRGRGYVADKEF